VLPGLDSLDLKLIELLRQDGRASFTALGEALDLSPDATRDRLRKLERDQVVRIIGRMEPRMLGFSLFAMLGVRLRAKHNEALVRAAALERVDFAARTIGRYDALIELVCFDEADVVATLDRGIRRIAEVEVVDALVYHEAVKWPSTLESADEPAQIDASDRLLLAHLQGDGRATYAALAKASEMTISTARRRVRSLLERGVLRIATVVHPAITERGYEASVMLNVTGPTAPVLARCAEIAEVTTVVGTNGRFDAVLAVATADREGMTAVTEQLRAIPGVAGTETFPVVEVLKLPEAWIFPVAE